MIIDAHTQFPTAPEPIMFFLRPRCSARSTPSILRTGRNFEDLVPIFKSIDWLSDDERQKITEGNAKKVFSRLAR